MDKPKDIQLTTVTKYIFHYVSHTYMVEFDLTLERGLKDLPEVPYYSESIHNIVLHYTAAFHTLFQVAYQCRFTLPCKCHLTFVSYVVSNCKEFMEKDFSFLERVVGKEKMPYFLFLMSAAFIAELAKFCLMRGCQTFINYGAKSLRMVYERYLKNPFSKVGGWEAFNDYCETVSPIYECLPNVIPTRVMGLPAYGKEITELRNRIEQSVNYYNGFNDLTDIERHLIGEVSLILPCFFQEGSLCGVCGFKR